MSKLRIFVNEPKGKTWDSFDNILPRLGEKYNLEVETISRTREAYKTAEYLATGLPIAPALMLDDEVLIQGGPISDEALELAIRRHLPGE